MNPSLNNPLPLDTQLDQLLSGLRNATLPRGLEQRTLAAVEARMTAVKTPTRRLASLRWTLAAATAALVLALVLFHANQIPPTTAATQSNPQPTLYNDATATPSQSSRIVSPKTRASITPAHPSSLLETAAARQPTDSTTALDRLALEETRAPSQSAPSLPLTAQERLLLRATRRGQPIEVAELALLREPTLRADLQAREHADVQRYVHGLFAPLVASQSLQPATTEPPLNTQPDTQPEPPPPPADQPSR